MIEIRLTLNKQVEPAKIFEDGKIKNWPGMTLEEMDDFKFIGISKSYKGDYAYTKNEMINEKINDGIYYPVVCDSLGNFIVIKTKILEINYVYSVN